MDWDALRVFLAVAKYQSHTRAAQALNVSQPTVSRAIAQLEAELKLKLFLSSGRALTPTPAGEAMLAHVTRMAQAADGVERLARGRDEAIEGVVRISASEGIGVLWLTHRILELRAVHRGLRIELLLDSAVADLGRREADLAIRLFRPPEPDLVAKRIGRLSFGLFASARYLREHGTPRRLTDLAQHDLVGFSLRGAVPSFARWWQGMAPPERFVLLTGNLLAQHEAARVGLGICLGADALLRNDRTLKRVLPRARPPTLDVYLVAHVDVRSSPRVAAVYEALARMLAQSPLAEPRARAD